VCHECFKTSWNMFSTLCLNPSFMGPSTIKCFWGYRWSNSSEMKTSKLTTLFIENSWICKSDYWLKMHLQDCVTELFEGHGQNISSWVFCLRLLWKNLCQLSLLFGRRIALLWRRLERVVHHQMCFLWVSHWGWRSMGRGSKQQLSQPML